MQALLRPAAAVTPPLATRHTIIATLQLWLTVKHPINPLRQVLCTGTLRDATEVEEIETEGEPKSVKAWATPAAQTSILCVLGDLCATAWPSSRSDRRLAEVSVQL